MNLKTFEKHMEAIKIYIDYLNATSDAFKIILPCDHISGLNARILEDFITLLCEAVGDKGGLISWFVFDCQYGENPLKYFNYDDIGPIKTVKQLYKAITKSK
jgi:hypothetical protein